MQYLVNNIKYTFLLAYPVMIGQLGLMLMGVVDSIMVGRIGAEPLAASSVGNSVFILIFIIGIGISYAVTPLTAIAAGARKFDECGIIFRQGLLVNTTSSIVLVIIVSIIAQTIQYLNQPPAVTALAVSYTSILGYSILPSMIFLSYKNFIEGLTVMRPAMIITLAANLINAFVNWLLIYGNWGFPELGLNGAGWATFSSRTFMMVMLIIYVHRTEFFRRFNVSLKNFKADIAIVKRLLNLGIPSGIQYFFEVGAFSFAVIMAGWLGTQQLAAHHIVINLASISFMAVLGISAAGSIRVGTAVGRGSIKETREAGFTAIIMGGSIMAVSGVIFVLFNHFLPSLYISDKGVLEYASSLMLFAALFQISDGVQAVGIGILRGLTDVKGPTLITFISYWILGLPIGYFLGFIAGMEVYGIWIGFVVGLTASALMLTLRFNAKSKRKVSLK
jgi:multidrug resistance protein, MATE family